MIAQRYLVDHVKPAVEFYSRLGFTVKEDWGPVVVMDREGLQLWISGPASSAGKTLVDGKKPANRLVVLVDGLEARAEEFRALTEIVRGPAGAWVVVADPAGNPVELFEPK